MAGSPGTTVVLKGPVTQVVTADVVAHSFFGGPVLARGGSGDVLAGLIGGLLAQAPQEPVLAAARGVVWHGCAADRLARSSGQVAVVTTDLLDELKSVLRELER
jgi:NAD(P)H-hydrate epimerase